MIVALLFLILLEKKSLKAKQRGDAKNKRRTKIRSMEDNTARTYFSSN